MDRKELTSSIFLQILVLLFLLILNACMTPSSVMRNDPLHINQHPPGKAQPIDGTWKTPWNDRIIIDRGRLYLPDFMYPMAVLKNITRVAPGKYRADNTDSKQIQGDNITLSVVSANKLVIITDMTEVAYTLLKAKNSKWHQADFKLAIKAAKTKKAGSPDNLQKQPVAFHQAVVEPAKVARGDTILIKALFSVFDENSSQKIVPVEYYYEIQNQDRVIYKSAVKAIEAVNGAKIPLEIKLKAASRQGDYKVVLKLSHEKGAGQTNMNFSIVTPEEARAYAAANPPEPSLQNGSVEERLLGKWKFVCPSFPPPEPVLIISKENNKLVAKLFMKGNKTLWMKLTINENNLIIRAKALGPVENCWYVTEDVITFNDEMDKMPVRSTIIDGSYCVFIGQIFKSTMHKIK
ncbi:MAG: hypothetical protein K8R67_07105 [Desulfobacteraceae bacterium]|nr:hypothetical protein [Desulfobacteraceae bacterium]